MTVQTFWEGMFPIVIVSFVFGDIYVTGMLFLYTTNICHFEHCFGALKILCVCMLAGNFILCSFIVV